MAIRLLAPVTAALLVQMSALTARGWRRTVTKDGFSAQQQIYVDSKERNARLTVACLDEFGKQPDLYIDVKNGIFAFYGGRFHRAAQDAVSCWYRSSPRARVGRPNHRRPRVYGVLDR